MVVDLSITPSEQDISISTCQINYKCAMVILRSPSKLNPKIHKQLILGRLSQLFMIPRG